MTSELDTLPAAKRQKSAAASSGNVTHNQMAGIEELLGAFASSIDALRQRGSESSHSRSPSPSNQASSKALTEIAKRISEGHKTGPKHQAVLDDFMHRLYEQSQELQSALDLHSLPDVPQYCQQAPSLEAAKRAAVYAHKLSYTTFAPDTVLSQNLFRPPAPQEWDFRASVLHRLAGNAAAAAPEQPLPLAASEERDKADEIMQTASRAQAGPPAFVAEPSMQEKPQEDVRKEQPPPAPQDSSGFISSAFDFILNPDLEEVEEDVSSSEEESED